MSNKKTLCNKPEINKYFVYISKNRDVDKILLDKFQLLADKVGSGIILEKTMEIDEKYQSLTEILDKYNQNYLLKYWHQLDNGQKQALSAQLKAIEWGNLQFWIDNFVLKTEKTTIASNFSPAPIFPAIPSDSNQELLYEKAGKTGRKLIADGKIAAFVVAGGQGSRLGYDGPKGNYPVSPVKNKTLFQIFAENIHFCEKKYTTTIPWYIMTSPLNHQATVEIFEKQRFFGLEKDNIMFFQQGTLPNFDFTGKILTNAKHRIATSPDGHGGSLKALYASGAIEDMKNRGIEQISYFQVDNPLVSIIDPLFIGLHALEGAQMSSKALKKASAREKVGNFCLIDGKITVIEYSDMPDDIADMTNPDGTLVFNAGSIAIHLISRAFVEKLNKNGFALPIHRAVKKIPYLNDAGQLISPDKPNGIKLETFVFDALPLAEKSIILETLRENEFAPVKNADGDDSPATAKKMISDRYAAWLRAAGVEVSQQAVIEISPLFAVSKEDVIAQKDRLPTAIADGQEFYIE